MAYKQEQNLEIFTKQNINPQLYETHVKVRKEWERPNNHWKINLIKNQKMNQIINIRLSMNIRKRNKQQNR
jgi:hypothetical protein